MASLRVERSTPERAFERLYRRHVSDVYRYASAVLANPADAEDVTQTTFMNAYRAFERGQRPERPLNWLIAIAHNVCRQRFRQQSRRPSEVALDYEAADEVVDDDRPRAEDIFRALSLLAFNQRAALVMRELEGRSYAEIATALDVSVAAVETLVFRARRALREQLEGTLTCSEAERAVSRQLDGMLARAERGALRAHLRACPDCSSLARRMRAQRSSLKSLSVLPLPASLASFAGTGGVGVATSAGAGGVLLKIAAVTAGSLAVGGTGYEAVTHRHSPSARTVQAAVSPAATRAQAPQRISLAHGTRDRLLTQPASPSRRQRPVHHAQLTTVLGAERPPQAQGAGSVGGPAAPSGKTQHGRSSPAASGRPGTHPTHPVHPTQSQSAAHSAQPPHAKKAQRQHSKKKTAVASSSPATPAVPASKGNVQDCRQAQVADPVAFAAAYGEKGDSLSRCVHAHVVADPAGASQPPAPGKADSPHGRLTEP
jgi:RNA polymerase sigma factor (sigma-70 family)